MARRMFLLDHVFVVMVGGLLVVVVVVAAGIMVEVMVASTVVVSVMCEHPNYETNHMEKGWKKKRQSKSKKPTKPIQIPYY